MSNRYTPIPAFGALLVYRILFLAVLALSPIVLSSPLIADEMDSRPKGPQFIDHPKFNAEVRQARKRLEQKLPNWFKANVQFVIEDRWKTQKKIVRIHDSNDWLVDYESTCQKQGGACAATEKWTIKALVQEWRTGTVEWYPRLLREDVLNDLIESANNKALRDILKLLKETSYGTPAPPLQAGLEAIKKLKTLGKAIPIIGEIMMTVSDMRDFDKLVGKIADIDAALNKFREEVYKVKALMGKTILTREIYYPEALFIGNDWARIDTITKKTDVPCDEFEVTEPKSQRLELTEDQRWQLYWQWRQKKAERDYSFLPAFPASCRKSKTSEPLVPEAISQSFDSEVKGVVSDAESYRKQLYDAVERCDRTFYDDAVTQLRLIAGAMPRLIEQRKRISDEDIKQIPRQGRASEDIDKDIKTARTPLSNAEIADEAVAKLMKSIPAYPDPCRPSKKEPIASLHGAPGAVITAKAGDKSKAIRVGGEAAGKSDCGSFRAEFDEIYEKRRVFIETYAQAELEMLQLEQQINTLKRGNKSVAELKQAEAKLKKVQTYLSETRAHAELEIRQLEQQINTFKRDNRLGAELKQAEAKLTEVQTYLSNIRVQAELEILQLERQIDRLKRDDKSLAELKQAEAKLEDAQNYKSNIRAYIDGLKAQEIELTKEYNSCIEERD